MNIRSLKPGDTVEVNVRGRKFEAAYVGPCDDGLHVDITPPRNITYYRVRKRDVLKRTAKAGRDPYATQITRGAS